MADEKISQLTDSGAPQDTDQLVIARAGSNFSLLFSALKAAIGSAFNGGTITGALTIAPTTDVTELTIQAPVGQTVNDLLDVVTASGDKGFFVFPTGAVSVTSDANNIALSVATANTSADILAVTDDLGNPLGGIGHSGFLFTQAHAAPADGDLRSGEVALWFDQTNGAAMLMFKAKSADGTVVTGSVPGPPSGSAGGDLTGTYPNPTVAKITETSGPTDLTIGTVADGQFLKRVGSTLVSAAGNAGTVTSVTATDTSIVVAGTGAAPTIATGTLDVVAADHPPAANWSNNSHKITSLANGSAASDAAAFGQIPTTLQPTDPGTNKVWGSNGAGASLGVLPPGFEISYTQITSFISIASSTEASGTTIFSPGAITFDGAPVICEVFGIAQLGSAASVMHVDLFEGSTEITRLLVAAAPTASTGEFFTIRSAYRFTPTAGSHTYTVTAFASATTGTQAVFGGAAAGTANGPPAFIRFVKV